MMHTSSRRIVAGLLVAGLVTASCGGSDQPSTSASVSSATIAETTTAGASRTTYPVTIEDCAGKQLTFAAAPRRVVTLDPAVTEILITLGLQDRIVGITLFSDADDLKLWAQTRDVMKSLPMINDPTVGYPSKETIVALSPDLVTSEYTSALTDSDTLPNQDGWTELGVNSYLTHGGCPESNVWTDLSILYQDIRDFGIIFDVQDRAEAEIASLQADVAELQQRASEAHLPNYRIGTHCCSMDSVGSLGDSTANAIITLAGSHYAFFDEDTGSQALSWELFIDKDPEVIWLITGLGQTADEIRQMLEGDPRVANVSAVKNHRYVEVSYDDVGESPRIIDGLTALVEGLIALQT